MAAGSATVERGKIGSVLLTRYVISSSLELALQDAVRSGVRFDEVAGRKRCAPARDFARCMSRPIAALEPLKIAGYAGFSVLLSVQWADGGGGGVVEEGEQTCWLAGWLAGMRGAPRPCTKVEAHALLLSLSKVFHVRLYMEGGEEGWRGQGAPSSSLSAEPRRYKQIVI